MKPRIYKQYEGWVLEYKTQGQGVVWTWHQTWPNALSMLRAVTRKRAA